MALLRDLFVMAACAVFLILFGTLLFVALTSPTLDPSGACPSGYQITHFLGTDLCSKAGNT